MRKSTLDKQKAINDWSPGASEVVSDTRAEGSPWLSPDSILRPNNMSLWFNMKQAEPEFTLSSPKGYEEIMREHRERVMKAEEEFKRKQQGR